MSKSGPMKTRRLVFLLALVLTLPLLAQENWESFMKGFAARLGGSQEEAVQYILDHPQQASQAFGAFRMVVLTQDQKPEQRRSMLMMLNILARTFEYRLGRDEYSRELRSAGWEFPEERWKDTPLAEGTRQQVDPVPLGPLFEFDPPPGMFQTTASLPLESSSGLLEVHTYQWARFFLNTGDARGATQLFASLGSGSNPQQAQMLRLSREANALALGHPVDFGDLRERSAALPPDAAAYLHILALEQAHRMFQPDLERQILAGAAPLQGKMVGPSAPLFRFILDSARFELEYLSDPDLPEATMLSRRKRVLDHLGQVPKEINVPPLIWPIAGGRAQFLMGLMSEMVSQAPAQRMDALGNHFLKELELIQVVFVDKIALDRSATGMDVLIQTVKNIEGVKGFDNEAMMTQLEPLMKDFGGVHLQVVQAMNQLLIFLPPDGTSAEPQFNTVLPGVISFFSRTQVELGLRHGRPLDQLKPALERARHYAQLETDVRSRLATQLVTQEFISREKAAGWQTELGKLAEESLGQAPETSLERSLGLYYRALSQGQTPGAIQDLEQAIGVIEEYLTRLGGNQSARRRVRDQFAKVYALKAELQLGQGDAEAALVTLDRQAQASSLANLGLEQAQNPRVREAAQGMARAQARTEALQEQLESAPAAEKANTARLLAQTKGEFTKYLADLKAEMGEGYTRFMAIRPMEFTRLQKSIPANTAVFQAFTTPNSDKLHLFVVTREKFRVRAVDLNGKDLTRLVRIVRRACRSYERAQGAFSWDDPRHGVPLREALTDLHRLMIDPIEPDIQDKEVIAFVPSGMLHYLPLSTLARDAQGKLEFLIERKKLVTLARVSDFMQLQDQSMQPTGRMFAFGNPDGTLPGAREEVLKLKSIFPDASVYVDKEATAEKLFAARDAAYLHLATHGVLNSERPDASYLVMGDPGRLTRYDIIDRLDLSGTRLVTLSACQTQLGEKNPGSEVTSIAESFWAAGSPAVMASLWRVSDESAQQVMFNFYNEVKGGRDLAGALQAAQLKLIQDPKYQHPYHWAPFVLWGDWR